MDYEKNINDRIDISEGGSVVIPVAQATITFAGTASGQTSTEPETEFDSLNYPITDRFTITKADFGDGTHHYEFRTANGHLLDAGVSDALKEALVEFAARLEELGG